MQTFIGRLTGNAKVNELKDGRKVVNFSLAINRRYKSKNSNTPKEITTYLNCSFWQNTAIAAHLIKGSMIATTGYTDARAWQTQTGEIKASLEQQVHAIEFFGKGKTKDQQPAAETITSDDLPF